MDKLVPVSLSCYLHLVHKHILIQNLFQLKTWIVELWRSQWSLFMTRWSDLCDLFSIVDHQKKFRPFFTFQTWGSNFKRLVFIEKVISNLPCAKYFCFVFLFKFHFNFGPAASHYWKHFYFFSKLPQQHDMNITTLKSGVTNVSGDDLRAMPSLFFATPKFKVLVPKNSAIFLSKPDIFYWWSTSELISSQEGFVRDWYTNRDQRNRDIAIIWYCESCQDQ